MTGVHRCPELGPDEQKPNIRPVLRGNPASEGGAGSPPGRMPELDALCRIDKERLARWRARVFATLRHSDLGSVCVSSRQDRPFGSPERQKAEAQAVGLELIPRPPGGGQGRMRRCT